MNSKQFNNFSIKTNMPGNIISHNADSIYHNTLEWNININNFSQQDYKLEAHSRIIYKKRAIILILITLLIIAGFLFIRTKILIKRKK